MNKICIDFHNRMIGIFTEGQEGTEHMVENIPLASVKPFFPDPELFDTGNNFTFDFESEEVSVNRPVIWDRSNGSIYGNDNFVPVKTVPAPGLSEQYEAFLAAIGYEETNTSCIIDEFWQAYTAMGGQNPYGPSSPISEVHRIMNKK